MIETTDFFADRQARIVEYLKYFILHLLAFVIVYTITAHYLHRDAIPTKGQVEKCWDVEWYKRILDNGYFYSDVKQSSVAFFPGFPYFWKVTHLNVFGISLVNTLIFFITFIYLGLYYKIRTREMVLYLSMPLMFVMYVPYSEALFFLFSAILLVGLNKNLPWTAACGLFLCGLTRSAANVFLPAIICLSILTREDACRWKKLLMYSIATFAGVFIVSFIQHSQTGEWFGFVKAQKHWEHSFGIPKLPLVNAANMIKLDGSAFLVGLSCGTVVLFAGYQHFRKRETWNVSEDFLFSSLYIAGVSLLALLFKQGALYSLGRYILPTAFFLIFMQKCQKDFKLSWKASMICMLIIITYWTVIMHSYVHIQIFLEYLVISSYLCLYILYLNKNKVVNNLAFAAIYLLNLVIQSYMFSQFLHKEWIA